MSAETKPRGRSRPRAEPVPKFPVPVHVAVDAPTEAAQRRAVIAAALSWVGTPYRQMCAVKGPKGGIDCSMLLVEAWIEGRVFERFDPRPYSPTWFLSKSEEKYLAWLDTIGERTEAPKAGDVVSFRFGRCVSHSGILIDEKNIVHAFAQEGRCTVSPLAWPLLSSRRSASFDMWAKLREAK